jgi:hypothetical protein
MRAHLARGPAEPGARTGVPTRDAAYRPGSCNIGEEEIARRRRWGDASLLAALALLALLIATDAPREARLVLFLPATGSAVGYLQARARFCAAFGLLGVFNFGRPGHVRRVADPEALRRDRAAALGILAASTLIGAGAALAGLLL